MFGPPQCVAVLHNVSKDSKRFQDLKLQMTELKDAVGLGI